MDCKQIVSLVVKDFFESIIYDGDDEEELEEECLTLLLEEEGWRRPNDRTPIPRLVGYVEEVPLFGDEFKSNFRMVRATFEFLLSEIQDMLVRTYNGNLTISPRKQLLIALWRMATPDSYRSIIERFGVGKATAIRAVDRVTNALVQLAPKYIKWPEAERIHQITNGFAHRGRFPGVIGALDGTHITIPAPHEHPEAYINRKNRYSIQLQAVCDHQGLFTHCFTGHVGSVHDARVFSLSSLMNFIADVTKFPGDTHLLADAAYSLHTRVLTPYADNGHLTQQQRNYNSVHSSTRMAIERAFGLLKGRWRSLLTTLAMSRTERIPHHIMACCVLHNICILRNDELNAIAVCNGADDGQIAVINRCVELESRDIAVAKRNRIAAELSAH